MTYFPQPDPAKRAKRIRLPGSVVVAVHSKGSQPVRAKLHELSATGGVLMLSKALEQGDFVEVVISDKPGQGSGYG
jgi:c-di-GMP-binding flagellar brake protein YcgR